MTIAGEELRLTTVGPFRTTRSRSERKPIGISLASRTGAPRIPNPKKPLSAYLAVSSGRKLNNSRLITFFTLGETWRRIGHPCRHKTATDRFRQAGPVPVKLAKSGRYRHVVRVCFQL